MTGSGTAPPPPPYLPAGPWVPRALLCFYSLFLHKKRQTVDIPSVLHPVHFTECTLRTSHWCYLGHRTPPKCVWGLSVDTDMADTPAPIRLESYQFMW